MVLKAVKDRVWYKLPLMGVLPQPSFRLTAVGWGWTQPNGSKPSTPPASAAMLLTLLHGMNSLVGESLPVLSGLDVLA